MHLKLFKNGKKMFYKFQKIFSQLLNPEMFWKMSKFENLISQVREAKFEENCFDFFLFTFVISLLENITFCSGIR